MMTGGACFASSVAPLPTHNGNIDEYYYDNDDAEMGALLIKTATHITTPTAITNIMSFAAVVVVIVAVMNIVIAIVRNRFSLTR